VPDLDRVQIGASAGGRRRAKDIAHGVTGKSSPTVALEGVLGRNARITALPTS
jgi:hypothetical protein